MPRLDPLDPTFVTVGAGPAGARAAETPRAEGFDGRLVPLEDLAPTVEAGAA